MAKNLAKKQLWRLHLLAGASALLRREHMISFTTILVVVNVIGFAFWLTTVALPAFFGIQVFDTKSKGPP